ncbi:MAG TPA: XdhC family protein [Candidatus Acidoferrales bacterium]|nr:XdhC family protein [Candidatus Acidoferrales bacterium]
MAGIYEQLAVAANQPFALALVAGTKGSSPQRAGAKAIFFADGKIIGTLGGGCLEAEVQARALKALKTGKSEAFEMVLDHDFGWDDGLICGGSVSGLILPRAAREAELWRQLAAPTGPIRWGVKADFSIAVIGSTLEPAAIQTGGGAHGVAGLAEELLYEETVSPPVELWIAGSGHVAQAVAPLAQQLDFSVTIFDDRPELANHQFFPPATKLRAGGWHELLKAAPSAPAFGLIVTRGHQHDALVLSEWVRFPFAFLGMIGSRRKARMMREQFIKQNLASAEQFDRIACPVGLDIAAVGPQEIAVSVIAQLIQKRALLRGK